MEIIQTSARKRESYKVEVKSSLLWECALGIAAITNTPLLSSLEKKESEWKTIKDALSADMLSQLEVVQKHNTWKALLQLLHQKEFTSIEDFHDTVSQLTTVELKAACLPFLGGAHQADVQKAAEGHKESMKALMAAAEDHSFFSAYISFICETDPSFLRAHLCSTLEGWYQTVIQPEAEQLSRVLTADVTAKKAMLKRKHPEEMVTWATGGINYSPEPSVHTVLLIPHIVYRPWNVEADLAGYKIFYYPVSNQSLHPADPYTPDQFLVLKYKALGDEQRMKMIKMLAEREHTLQEMTNRLGMGKTTVHHHLKILKSARLVQNNGPVYSLNGNVLQALSDDLENYLDSGL
ncbi:ArsR family transcriptional regulator [Sediminibacillus dalangtanensis]|uniref:ArsR family transcriptional regulator n=1 Tax=Sediminibacillus dalangtanensis TaxID=2729421 RepID=A0ABX7VTP8_9BACI|nr:metalloregulator ArsR/SmtB family transcription factor [Sediminibacillus dalangtanensis]QTM97961.1 ArsR family transcriptional regulator [Sediminibacillus dalangtanensis]